MAIRWWPMTSSPAIASGARWTTRPRTPLRRWPRSRTAPVAGDHRQTRGGSRRGRRQAVWEYPGSLTKTSMPPSRFAVAATGVYLPPRPQRAAVDARPCREIEVECSQVRIGFHQRGHASSGQKTMPPETRQRCCRRISLADDTAHIGTGANGATRMARVRDVESGDLKWKARAATAYGQLLLASGHLGCSPGRRCRGWCAPRGRILQGARFSAADMARPGISRPSARPPAGDEAANALHHAHWSCSREECLSLWRQAVKVTRRLLPNSTRRARWRGSGKSRAPA